MISLEQIRQLESRVHSAVERIRSLTAENSTLRTNLSQYEQRIEELEKMVFSFKSEQQEIEAGIVAALAQLDGLEDSVTEPSASESIDGNEPDDTGTGDTAEPDSVPDSDDGTDLGQQVEDSRAAEPDEPVEEVMDEQLAEEPPERPSPAVELIDADEEAPELDIF